MIVYLDASALVKRYVAEAGSVAVEKLIDQAEALGTSVISRAEVSAAFAKAIRMKFVTRNAAATALKLFTADWTHFMRLQLTETLAARAASSLGNRDCELRRRAFGNGAGLARKSQPVLVATFDRQLWQAAQSTAYCLAEGMIRRDKSPRSTGMKQNLRLLVNGRLRIYGNPQNDFLTRCATISA